MRTQLLSEKVSEADLKLSSHIPIVGHYDECTLIAKDGALLQVIKLGGYNFFTEDDDVLIRAKDICQGLFNSLQQEPVALYFHTVHRNAPQYPDGEFTSIYADRLNTRMRDAFLEHQHFVTEYYLTFIHSGPSHEQSFLESLAAAFGKSRTNENQKKYLIQARKTLEDITNRYLCALSHYRPERLTCFEKEGVNYSKPLSFINTLINWEFRDIPLVCADYSSYLPSKRLYFGHRVIKWEGASDERFASLLSLKGYPKETHYRHLNDFLSLPFEFIMTQSFVASDRRQLLGEMQLQQDRLLSTEDAAVTQVIEIDSARELLASGEAIFGYHHLTMLCIADNLNDLEKSVALSESAMINAGMQVVREDLNLELGFFAMLPHNFNYIARRALISTANLASLNNWHNFVHGKLKNHHWGDAAMSFEQQNGSHYHYGLHVEDLANTLILGRTGSGKTLAVDTLLAMCNKYNPRIIFFDYERGSEVFLRAMGADYVKVGTDSLAFNPLQMDDNAENRRNLEFFLEILLSPKEARLDSSALITIHKAIDTIYDNKPSDRTLAELAPSLGTGPLRHALSQWLCDGTRGQYFSSLKDSLNLDKRIYGLDMTALLNDETALTPVLWYLFMRVSDLMKQNPHERFIIVLEEGWSLLKSPLFREQLKKWLLTIRRRGGMVMFLTQHPSHLMEYPEISQTILNSCPNQFYFADSKADKTLYGDVLKLSQKERKIIRELNIAERYFLLRQDSQSVIARINPKGIAKDILILSGNEKRAKLLDELRTIHGDEFAAWQDEYLQRAW